MPDPRDRTIRLRGRDCRLRFVPQSRLMDDRTRLDGLCLPLSRPPRILILESLTGQHLLETLLHEMLHFCLWDICEHAVTESARDIARGIRPQLEAIVDDLT